MLRELMKNGLFVELSNESMRLIMDKLYIEGLLKKE